jgi:hypothetical protein
MKRGADAFGDEADARELRNLSLRRNRLTLDHRVG